MFLTLKFRSRITRSKSSITRRSITRPTRKTLATTTTTTVLNSSTRASQLSMFLRRHQPPVLPASLLDRESLNLLLLLLHDHQHHHLLLLHNHPDQARNKRRTKATTTTDNRVATTDIRTHNPSNSSQWLWISFLIMKTMVLTTWTMITTMINWFRSTSDSSSFPRQSPPHLTP